MPELPEVENVRRDLEAELRPGTRIAGFDFFRADLRDPIPKARLKKLVGCSLTHISRRAKYLLFHTEGGIILSHLGMTGQWRIENAKDQKASKKSAAKPSQPHDHVRIRLASGQTLVYRDPRRFGVLDFASEEGCSNWNLSRHPRLRHLGPEPLDRDFDGHYLFEQTRGRKSSIKSLIMNQEIVVGVGNIYACEALYRAGLRPQRKAHGLDGPQCERLAHSIRQVLAEAIAQGGSTIRDYRRPDASAGGFQEAHAVYDREGKNCPSCRHPIRRSLISGRSSFYCPSCQH